MIYEALIYTSDPTTLDQYNIYKISSHAFWNTQSVHRQDTDSSPDGLLNPTLPSASVLPCALPPDFSWSCLDIFNPSDSSAIYELLRSFYVADVHEYFRFEYSIDFLQWTLSSSGCHQEFNIGILHHSQLIAFLSASQVSINISGSLHQSLEVNFLCISKAYRGHRFTPLLVQEITRKAHLRGILIAVYTSGTLIHSPIAKARYHQRFLDSVKLERLGYTCFDRTLGPRFFIRKYQVEDTLGIEGLRPMAAEDAPGVQELLMGYLRKFALHQEFTVEDVVHYFCTRSGVVYSWVAEEQGRVVDFFSFYVLGIRSARRVEAEKINAAYCFYYASCRSGIEALFKDMLVCAKRTGVDILHALDIMDSLNGIKDLLFERTEGHLNYYIYNWKSQFLEANLIGKVLV